MNCESATQNSIYYNNYSNCYNFDNSCLGAFPLNNSMNSLCLNTCATSISCDPYECTYYDVECGDFPIQFAEPYCPMFCLGCPTDCIIAPTGATVPLSDRSQIVLQNTPNLFLSNNSLITFNTDFLTGTLITHTDGTSQVILTPSHRYNVKYTVISKVSSRPFTIMTSVNLGRNQVRGSIRDTSIIDEQGFATVSGEVIINVTENKRELSLLYNTTSTQPDHIIEAVLDVVQIF